MAHDTADSAGKVPQVIGDLFNVDDAAPGNLATLVYSAADTEFKVTAPSANVVALTDSTGGTPDNTIADIPPATAAVTDTSAASLTSVNTALAAAEANICDLTAKVNALLAAAKLHGAIAADA